MTPEQAAKLREPFPDTAVGKLPRVTKKDSPKSRCKVCGGWLPEHIHLDYVGHAAVTDRLLQVDPEWTWEPYAIGDDGLPALVTWNGEAHLWVRLTVGGVTRIGVGTAPAGAFELGKQVISDAIRNAAMRFGVALDLWAKEDLSALHDAPEPQPAPTPDPRVEPIRQRAKALTDAGVDVAAEGKAHRLPPPARCTSDQLDAWESLLSELEATAPFAKETEA